MLAALSNTWALFFGLFLIMLGNGLQGSLLGLRATMEGFPTSVTGIILSGYFVGFLAGSVLIPRMIRAVGHVRVFAAVASIASTSVLVHGLLVEPISWTVMRVATGFALSGIYLVTESWLNDMADNQSRGQILAIYMVVVLGGLALGQQLLQLADPGRLELFVIVSVLISVALVPVLLSASKAPAFEQTRTVGLRRLYQVSPLGVVGSFLVGTSNATVSSLVVVYAGKIGVSVSQAALLVSMIYVGGALFQWPIGRLSDRFDRRSVLTVVTFIAAGAALAAPIAVTVSPFALLACAALLGGTSFPLYSLLIAHTNDYLERDEMVAAAASLYLVVGMGSALGPSLGAFLMDWAGNAALFVFVAAVHAGIGFFALYRMIRRSALPLEAQGETVTLLSGVTGSAAQLLPEADPQAEAP